MADYTSGNGIVRDALAEDQQNLANVVWVDQQPTADQLDSDYVYMWIDSNENLTVGSLDESGNLLNLTLNVAVDGGDAGLIGGLLG